MEISARRRQLYLLIASLLAMALLVAVFELALVLVSRVPALYASHPIAIGVARRLYMGGRNVIQYMPRAARYDPELGYTLRPGRFRFANREFDVGFEVNSLGVRDDEASLRAPEIVVVGDSMAMGWGVEQHQTFAELLARRTGLSVLNAAISSYGTARELLLLDRVDLSRARFLIIQYCENDDEENESFQRAGYTLEVMTPDAYADRVEQHGRARRYLPGQGLWRGVAAPLRRAIADAIGGFGAGTSDAVPSPDTAAYRQREVDLFLDTLLHSRLDLSRLETVVFELNSRNRDSDWFIPLLAETIRGEDLPHHIQRIRALPLAGALEPRDFFVLDDHIRPSGHQKIAEGLFEALAPLS